MIRLQCVRTVGSSSTVVHGLVSTFTEPQPDNRQMLQLIRIQTHHTIQPTKSKGTPFPVRVSDVMSAGHMESPLCIYPTSTTADHAKIYTQQLYPRPTLRIPQSQTLCHQPLIWLEDALDTHTHWAAETLGPQHIHTSPTVSLAGAF